MQSISTVNLGNKRKIQKALLAASCERAIKLCCLVVLNNKQKAMLQHTCAWVYSLAVSGAMEVPAGGRGGSGEWRGCSGQALQSWGALTGAA